MQTPVADNNEYNLIGNEIPFILYPILLICEKISTITKQERSKDSMLFISGLQFIPIKATDDIINKRLLFILTNADFGSLNGIVSTIILYRSLRIRQKTSVRNAIDNKANALAETDKSIVPDK